MHYLAVAQILILLTVANVSPLVAKRIFGKRLSCPLDGNIAFFDGRPLLGPAKTIRGIVCSLAATTATAPLLGLGFEIGAAVALAAMGGDLLSSFIKRRLGLAPSSRATGLDQLPEALLPTLVVRQALALSAADIAIVVLIFFAGEIVFARLFAWLRLRDQPY